MRRKNLLVLLLALTFIAAGIAAVASEFPASELMGWTAAIAATAVAGWVFFISICAWRQLRARSRQRNDRLRSRLTLLLLVRDLRDACAVAAAARVPAEAPADARAACERLCDSLLGFHPAPASWEPLGQDLSRLRVAIRAGLAMLHLRPEQLRFVGSPFRFLQEQCEEVLGRHVRPPAAEAQGASAPPPRDGERVVQSRW